MIYSSWDIEQNILKLVILGHFLPFYPLQTPKIKILKNENICCRYHHFTHVYQKSQSYDVWFLTYGVRQLKIIKALEDITHFTNSYHKWQSYDIWFFRYGVQQTRKKQPGKSKFWKTEKSPGAIIILHKCTKNRDHML